MTNYALWWFVQPSHLLLFLLAVGLILLLTGRRSGRWLLPLGAAGLLFAALGPAGWWLIAPLEEHFAPPPPSAPAPHGIIVLAGAEQPALFDARGTPHFNGFAERITTFAILAARYPEARLVHSGRGAVREDLSQTPSSTAAAVLEPLLRNRQITYEDRSANTWEAAVEVSRLLAPQARERRWWLVTSAFHMPRAVASFRAVGMDVVPVPTDYQRTGRGGPGLPDPVAALEVTDWAAHEWLGLLYYRLRGRTRVLWPAPTGPADGAGAAGPPGARPVRTVGQT